jgi:hypothetical protein
LVETKLPRLIQGMMAFFIIASASMGFYQHTTYTGFPYGPYAELNKSVQSRMEDGDIIIHSNKLSYLPALYFDSTLSQGFVIDPPGSTIDTLAPATREVLNLNEYATIEEATFNSTRIWFIIYQRSIDEFASNNRAKHPHLEFLDASFTLLINETWEDINLLLYSRKIP